FVESPGIVVGAAQPREAVDEDERVDTLGIGRREDAGEERAGHRGHDRHLLAPDVVEDRPEIVHPLLKRRERGRSHGAAKPTPGLSKRITRANAASRSLNLASGLTSRSISTLLNHCSATTTSTSPDPNVRYAMCTSPLFAYRVGLGIRSV